ALDSISVFADLVADADGDNTGDIDLFADIDASGSGLLLISTNEITGENVMLRGYEIVADALVTADNAGNGAGDVVIAAGNSATFTQAITAGLDAGAVDIVTIDGSVLGSGVDATITAGGAIVAQGGLDTTLEGDVESINESITI